MPTSKDAETLDVEFLHTLLRGGDEEEQRGSTQLDSTLGRISAIHDQAE